MKITPSLPPLAAAGALALTALASAADQPLDEAIRQHRMGTIAVTAPPEPPSRSNR